MNRRKHNYIGSLLANALVAVVALVSLATAGWFVYEHNRPNVSDAAATDQSVAQSSMQTPASQAATNLDHSKQSVVTIPELGVDITVPADIKDLTYHISTVTLRDGDQATLAMFSTKALAALDSRCGNNFGPLGSLEKAVGTYPTQSQDESNVLDYGQLVKKFPTFYISTGSPQTSCSANGNAQNAANKFEQEFKASLSTISPTQF